MRFCLEKIFLSRVSTIFYKLMCSYGKMIMVKNTMILFERIVRHMIKRKEKIGVIKIKRIWYFGRMHDKEMDRARKYMGSNRNLTSSQRKNLLYHNGKEKEFYFGF